MSGVSSVISSRPFHNMITVLKSKVVRYCWYLHKGLAVGRRGVCGILLSPLYVSVQANWGFRNTRYAPRAIRISSQRVNTSGSYSQKSSFTLSSTMFWKMPSPKLDCETQIKKLKIRAAWSAIFFPSMSIKWILFNRSKWSFSNISRHFWINDIIKMWMNYDIDIQCSKLTMQIDASQRYLWDKFVSRLRSVSLLLPTKLRPASICHTNSCK